MKIRKALLLFLAGFLFFNALLVSGKEPAKIRVAVLKDIDEATLAISGSFNILNARTQEVLYHGKNLAVSKVVPVAGGLKIKELSFNTDSLLIVSKRKAAITINNRSYRGDISIFKSADNKLIVVNTLDLEFYIKGVLYHEISHQWPIDAIKAQAVAARTYAVYQKETNASKDYDLTADTSSQVYGGYDSEKHKTNRAVNFTNGEVLQYQGKVFPAYFHATCGGMTEDANELWNIDIEPLKGGRVCSFCLDSPHYYWKVELDLKTIQKKLSGRYSLRGDLKNIIVAQRNATGRIRTLKLEDNAGEHMVISAKDFRAFLGPDSIRSTNFSIVFDKEHVILQGKGWGHGVGLCQWGALGMSRKGYNYKQILAFYYPGAEVVKML
jgi:stage II sporulation protein D